MTDLEARIYQEKLENITKRLEDPDRITPYDLITLLDAKIKLEEITGIPQELPQQVRDIAARLATKGSIFVPQLIYPKET